MNTKPVIMVQISDREWTLEALHCACLLARNTSARIALVKMVPVQHATWLGTNLGYMNLTYQGHAEFVDYQTTIEDYGVEFTPLVFQYITLIEATVQAAEHVNARIVFASIPASIIPWWTKLQRWMLRRQLIHQRRQLIQHPVYNTVTLTPIPDAVAEINQP
jgi:hypothetical protein